MKIFAFSLLACVVTMGRAYAQNSPVRFSAISKIPTSACPSVWDALNQAYGEGLSGTAEIKSSQLYGSLEKLFTTTDIDEFLRLAKKISFYDATGQLQDPEREEFFAKRTLEYHLNAITTIYTIATFFVHVKMDEIIHSRQFERSERLIHIAEQIKKNLKKTLSLIENGFANTFRKAESNYMMTKFMEEDLARWNLKIDLYLSSLQNL